MGNNYFTRKNIVVTILIFFTVLGIFGQATLVSDQSDYAPGSTATFSGDGFQAGESVKMQVIHADEIPNSGENHGEWFVTANESGSFVTTWHVCEDDCLGSTLRAYAEGQNSGLQAYVEFTDADPIVISGGFCSGSVTTKFTATVPSNVGNIKCLRLEFPVGFSISNVLTGDLPAGWSASIGGVSVNISGATNLSTNTTYTFYVTFASAPSGNYSVASKSGSSCPNNTSGGNVATVVSGTGTSPNPPTAVNFSGTYDGASHAGSANGIAGETIDWYANATGSTVSAAPTGTNFGTYIAYAEARNTTTGCVSASRTQVTVNIGKANSTTVVTITGSPFTYTGSPITPATVSVIGAGGLNLSPIANYTNNTDAGNATASYTYAGDANHNGSNDSKNFTINKADAVVTVNGYTGVYDANPHGATGSASGVGGVDLSSDLSLGATFTNVPGGTANWSFSGGTNYNDQNGTAAIVINKADAVVTVNGYIGVYDANPHGATGSASGVGGVDLSSDLSLGATFTNVPGGTANWSFSGGTNYNDQSGTAAIVINKTDAVVTINGYIGVYDANPHGATGSASGVGGVDLSSDLSLGATFTNVPGGNANWSFSGGTNYNDQSGTAAIVINKTDAVVTVNGYTGVYDANPHGATGSASGVGGVDLSSDLSLGVSLTNVPGGTANWSFSGGTNYNDQSGTAAIVINKADAVVTVNGYTGVYDANPHGATGSASGVGGVDLSSDLSLGATFTNVPGGNANWSFSGGTNYNDQSGTAAIVINKTDAVVTVNGYTGVYDANPHGATGSASGVAGVDLSSDLSLGATFTNVPGGTANWSFSGGTNYNDQNGTAAIVINKTDANITVTSYNVTYDTSPHTSVGSAKGVLNENLAGLNLNNTTHTNAGTYNADPWTFTDITGNYNNANGTVDNAIGKATATITINSYVGIYDAAYHTASGTATGVNGANLNSSLTFLTTFRNVPGGNTNWSFNGGTNYFSCSGSKAVTITPKDLTVYAAGINKGYDGSTTATVTLSTNKMSGDLVTPSYAAANFANPNTGTWNVSVTGIAITGADTINYNLLNTTASATAQITAATTTTTLITSAESVRYMDNLTMTAKIKPVNNGNPLTGTVAFSIGGVSYGSAPVVSIPGASDGSVQAMMIKQVSNLPAGYTVTAVFTSSNANYSGSQNTKSLTVVARNASPYTASGFYTGDLFAWTTGPNTSTATVTLVAAIKDANSPTGDVRGAKVTFYFVNGSTLTPIPSAQNLPVGLVDVTDGSVGTASAIVQLNIGSSNAESFQIAVGITGAYINSPANALSQTIVTVSKPVAGGYIVGGGQVCNANSSGYIKGHSDLNSDYQFDIAYTKSGTNPKGKVNILVRSYYTKDGILDSKLHTYLITTNSIALLNVTTPQATGTFSAKANLVEQLEDLSTVAIEGGATFQMTAFQNGCSQQIAITLYRKAGGVWFSSNWNTVSASTQLKGVTTSSKVYVSGGGSCSSPLIKDPSPETMVEVTETKEMDLNLLFNVKAYPNPSSQYFNLDIQGNDGEETEVMVYNSAGILIDQFKGKVNQEYQIGDRWSSGIYLVQINKGTEVKTIKLIKRN